MAASLTIEGPELRSPVLAVLAAGWPVLRGEGGGGGLPAWMPRTWMKRMRASSKQQQEQQPACLPVVRASERTSQQQSGKPPPRLAWFAARREPCMQQQLQHGKKSTNSLSLGCVAATARGSSFVDGLLVTGVDCFHVLVSVSVDSNFPRWLSVLERIEFMSSCD
ncbi:uncharacterized protein [Physcomitrium patens]|uniref:uncharacterized protein n=1 Tax=Physcomitrium patens TaxID=3218 RepID=UPI003CCE12BD